VREEEMKSLLQIPRRAIFENSERNEKEKQFAQKGNDVFEK
jgi:hypothetical protein